MYSEKLREAGFQYAITGLLGPSTGWDGQAFGHHLLEEMALAEWDVLDYKSALLKGFIDQEEYVRAIHEKLFVPSENEHFMELLRVRKLWVPYWTEDWKVGGRGSIDEFISGDIPVYYGGTFDIPIVYFTQLMGIAYGDDAKTLGLQKHFTDAIGLLREKGILSE